MKLLNDIQTWTVNDVLIGWFVAFIVHQQLNIAYRIKRLFKWSITRYRKFPDCYPCFTFWTTLIITFEPISAIAAYLIAVIIDRK